MLSGSLHQLHNADTVEEEDSENELSTNQTQNMAATAGQPSTDVKVMKSTQDIIGQNTGHVTTGAVRFKDCDQTDAGKSEHAVNGQGVRPKAKQLHRKNTPATLPTVQKLCKSFFIFFNECEKTLDVSMSKSIILITNLSCR